MLPDEMPDPLPQPSPLESGPSDLQPQPPEESVAAEPAPRRMVYFPAYRYAFENPDWFSTVIFSSVIGFLPVLGQIAQMGFYYDIVEALYRRPDAPYPKFEFRRFGDYCMRGVWPYVLAMAVGVAVYLVVWLPTQLTLQFGFIFLVNRSQIGVLVLAIISPVILLGVTTILLAVTTLSAPFMLRAGLTQDFRRIFQYGWCKGYLKKMWVEEVLATLFVLASTIVIVAAGCCLFVYGAYAAGAIASIASAHIRWQIYEIYLERGGEPIPLHPLPAEAPPVQMDVKPQ